MDDIMDSKQFEELTKLKSLDDADALLTQTKPITNEVTALKEVVELRNAVADMEIMLHSMWLMLKEKGYDNDELDKALSKAVLLSKRTDFKNIMNCPMCGKGLQKMEQIPFTYKCYYCGAEVLGNPYRKYDDLNPEATDYQTPKPSGESVVRGTPEMIEADITGAQKEDLTAAKEILNQSFTPYDVSKDLNFDNEDI